MSIIKTVIKAIVFFMFYSSWFVMILFVAQNLSFKKQLSLHNLFYNIYIFPFRLLS